MKLSSTVQNFIVICEDVTDLDNIATLITNQIQNRQLVQVPSFDVDPTEIPNKLQQLKKAPSISLTNQDGGIAVDWNTVEESHTIFGFAPAHSS